MASVFSLFMTGKTDPGLCRDHNEDSIAWDAERGVALLADGMGGHKAGDVASRMVVESLLPILQEETQPEAESLRQAIAAANAKVFAAGEAEATRRGMGCTLVAALFHADRLLLGHAGDSRIYRLRGRQFEALTKDHSLVRQMLESGAITAEEMRDNPFGHVITEAMGVRDTVAAEVQELEVLAGDVYLLCSDGLTDMLTDAVIAETLSAYLGHWDRAAQRLVDLANQQGGRDNISVVLVGLGPRRVEAEAASPA